MICNAHMRRGSDARRRNFAVGAAAGSVLRAVNFVRHSGRRAAAISDAQLRIGESRDSPVCNCTPEVWSFGPSRNDQGNWGGLTHAYLATGRMVETPRLLA